MASDLVAKMMASKGAGKTGPDVEVGEAPEADMDMSGSQAVCQEMIEAFQAGDAQALDEALKSYIQMMKE